MADIFCDSADMLSELNEELSHSIFMDGILRLDLVYECCELSIEHGRAILQLLQTHHDVSALALFRVQFEAAVRAYWLLMVASNDEIQHFDIKNEDELLEKVKIPTASGMINGLGNVAEIKQIV